MAIKKDGDKGKKTLSGKKPLTMSGKQPYKMGEINYTDMSGKKRMIKADGPKSKSIMLAKGPAPKMNAEATGERNFDRSSEARRSVSIGPISFDSKEKSSKSTGPSNITGGKIPSKKTPAITGKSKQSKSNKVPKWESVSSLQKEAEKQKVRAKKSAIIGGTILGVVGGAGLTLAIGKKKKENRYKREDELYNQKKQTKK